ncbi:unnamed protein product [Prunus brigantina]
MVWKGDYDDKSLYICLAEHRVDGYSTYAIKAVELSALSSSSLSSGCSLKLRQVAYTSGEDLPDNMACGVFGSKILLAGGTIGVYDPIIATQEGRYNPKLGGFVPCPCTEIQVFDTRNQSQSPTTFRTFGSFIEGKANPFLLEMDGKLYALASYPIQSSINSGGSSYFEVLDPIRGVWSTLPYPPVFDDYNRTYAPAGPGDFFGFVAGSNIFCTSAYSPSYYRFDVAEPVKGWRALPPSFNSGPLPENILGRTFVADGGDGEFILFSFSYGEPCPRLCLLLSSFDSYVDGVEKEEEELIVFALQFEFTKKKDSLDVQFLGTNIFVESDTDTQRPQESDIYNVKMLGAILFSVQDFSEGKSYIGCIGIAIHIYFYIYVCMNLCSFSSFLVRLYFAFAFGFGFGFVLFELLLKKKKKKDPTPPPLRFLLPHVHKPLHMGINPQNPRSNVGVLEGEKLIVAFQSLYITRCIDVSMATTFLKTTIHFTIPLLSNAAAFYRHACFNDRCFCNSTISLCSTINGARGGGFCSVIERAGTYHIYTEMVCYTLQLSSH